MLGVQVPQIPVCLSAFFPGTFLFFSFHRIRENSDGRKSRPAASLRNLPFDLSSLIITSKTHQTSAPKPLSPSRPGKPFPLAVPSAALLGKTPKPPATSRRDSGCHWPAACHVPRSAVVIGGAAAARGGAGRGRRTWRQPRLPTLGRRAGGRAIGRGGGGARGRASPRRMALRSVRCRGEPRRAFSCPRVPGQGPSPGVAAGGWRPACDGAWGRREDLSSGGENCSGTIWRVS